MDRHQGICRISTGFVSEAHAFREAIRNPALSPAERRRAYDRIVHHAARLDPRDAGFARAGVALKEALCAWLDVAATSH
jgi:hypothetical protein